MFLQEGICVAELLEKDLDECVCAMVQYYGEWKLGLFFMPKN